MPVQIVDNNSATSIKDGTIQIGDLENMTDEYKDHVALTPIPPRNVVVKRNSFYFTKDQVEKLFLHYDDNSDANAIEIAIGIQLPGSKVICDEVEKNNSNCLAVIISMANKTNLDPLNEVGDYVLINGYQPGAEFIETEICCPGSKPPPPENEI